MSARLRRRLVGLDSRRVDGALATGAARLAELERERERLEEEAERLARDLDGDDEPLLAAVEVARRVACEIRTEAAAQRERAFASARAAAADAEETAGRELAALEAEVARERERLAARRTGLERTLRDLIAHLDDRGGEPLGAVLDAAVHALTRRLGVTGGPGERP
jgi:hypothetical protein